MNARLWPAATILSCLCCVSLGYGQTKQLDNLNAIASDLIVPDATAASPAAGRRVKGVLNGYQDWELFHTLYLPRNWRAGQQYPVIVEFPGNGGYQNAFGDVSTGRVEDCKLGYGISGGENFIWLCLPFVDVEEKQHALTWWGDPDATASYARQAVKQICGDFGGDPDRVVLTGFSRGALACSYIGLRDAATAKLWKAMILHSHYDGVRRWSYADSDAASARQRWRRFAGKPQFVTQEKSVEDIRAFLGQAASPHIQLQPLLYPNHTDTWILKDIPLRDDLRHWLQAVLAK